MKTAHLTISAVRLRGLYMVSQSILDAINATNDVCEGDTQATASAARTNHNAAFILLCASLFLAGFAAANHRQFWACTLIVVGAVAFTCIRREAYSQERQARIDAYEQREIEKDAQCMLDAVQRREVNRRAGFVRVFNREANNG